MASFHFFLFIFSFFFPQCKIFLFFKLWGSTFSSRINPILFFILRKIHSSKNSTLLITIILLYVHLFNYVHNYRYYSSYFFSLPILSTYSLVVDQDHFSEPLDGNILPQLVVATLLWSTMGDIQQCSSRSRRPSPSLIMNFKYFLSFSSPFSVFVS